MQLWVINVYSDHGVQRLLFKSQDTFDAALALPCIFVNHREAFDILDDYGVRVIVAIGKLDRIFAAEMSASTEADTVMAVTMVAAKETIEKRVKTRLGLIEGGKNAS